MITCCSFSASISTEGLLDGSRGADAPVPHTVLPSSPQLLGTRLFLLLWPCSGWEFPVLIMRPLSSAQHVSDSILRTPDVFTVPQTSQGLIHGMP